jgi:uncharacterized cupin superfamily protein
VSGWVHPVNGAAAARQAPVAPERVLEGSPLTVAHLDYNRDDKVFAGEWTATPGAWRVSYDEWEFCHILEGACELIGDEDGVARRFEAGDSLIIEPGFVGVWRVLAPMRKRFVVRYP